MKTESYYTHDESCYTFEPPISHISTSHGARVNESYRTGGWVMSHMNESCHAHTWTMSHIWMIHVTHMDESSIFVPCRTPVAVSTSGSWTQISHIWIESCHAYGWLIHMCVWHNQIRYTSWLWNESCHADMNEPCHTYEIGLFAYQWLHPRTRSLEHRAATVPSCVLQCVAVCCSVLSVCCSVLCLRMRSWEHCATTVPSCVLQCFAMCWVCVAAYWVRAATCCSAHCNCTFLCVALYSRVPGSRNHCFWPSQRVSKPTLMKSATQPANVVSINH